MTLWIAIAVMTVLSLLWVLRPLIMGTGRGMARASYDRQIYRDQLSEIERDHARGVIDAAEAEASRAEVARRLLAADEAARRDPGSQAGPAPVRRAAAVLLAVGVTGAALGLYLVEGAPRLSDAPLAERQAARPSQAAFEAQLASAGVDPAPAPEGEEVRLAEMVTQLRTVLETRPNDLRGHRLLAGALARMGHFAQAHRAQARVIQIAGEAATAEDHVEHAELMILAAQGYVSPEAEMALAEALQRDPALKPARYYAGLAMAQAGRPEQAFNLWAGLLAEGPADAPWIAPIREQIGPLAAMLGQTVPQPPAPGPGPTAEDMEAAAQMTPEARQQMIRGMVDGLAERLASEGGPAEDWARLIGALGVLGERDRAASIWAEAQAAFAGEDAALATLRAAALAAGLAD
jgi:cytochrome c-type biogenesis protein CcmH